MNPSKLLRVAGCLLILLCAVSNVAADKPAEPSLQDRINGLGETIDFVQQRLTKTIADQMWFERFRERAVVDKIRFVGPPPRNTEQRRITTNGVVISAYTFMPAGKVRRKIPLIV